MPVVTQIQLRRGTASQWTSSNPTLAAGEMGVETDTGLSKIGNGSTAWNSLSYAPALAPLIFNAQTGTTYTFVLSDSGDVVTADNASAQTYTIPPSGSVAFTAGTQITVLQKGTGQVTIAQGAGVTIRSTGVTATAPRTRARYSSCTLICEGSNIWYVVGDIV
jgi:hypothetical protein